MRILSYLLAFFIAVWLCPIYSYADEYYTQGRELAIQKMKNGFYNFDDKIDLTDCGITPDDISELFVFVIKNDPFLFFVDTKLSYSYKSDGSMFQIMPQYTATPYETARMIEYCTQEITRISSLSDSRLSDAEKALLIHDYLCAEYRYDASYVNDDMYKFLSAKMGTCQGYAWTYMAILRQLGIECCYVASDTINHIWNMVKIDGEWYHSDVTWDDGTEGKIDRRHFLCSDTKIMEQGHKDWYSAYSLECSSTTYDTYDFNLLTHTIASGDADHDRDTGLYDLLLLRINNKKQGAYGKKICQICADANKDMVLDGHDIELLRQKILQCDEKS